MNHELTPEGMGQVLAWAAILLPLLLGFYIYVNDIRLKTLPSSIASLSKRCTPQDVRSMSARLASEKPISIEDQLPPKTGRKYIIVGGVSRWKSSVLLNG